MHPRFRKILWLLAVLTAFVISHVPPPKRPIPPLAHDKTLHAIGFTILGALTVWRIDVKATGISFATAVAWYLGLLAYGAFDELTQPITGRSCELTDWLADACGAAIGIVLVVLHRRRQIIRAIARQEAES